jgi:O-antigen/teichoic acid export membrane protein
MDSITSRARTAFRWTLSFRLISQLFTWFASLFVIRLLTPADYGIVAISETVLMLALQFAAAGLGDVLVRQKELNDKYIRKILGILILLNGCIALLLLSFASSIAQFYQQPALEYVFYLTASVFFVMPWITVSSNLLARELNFKSRSKIDFIATLSGSTLALLMAFNGFGFWSLIVANVVVIFIRSIGYNLALRRFYLPLFQFGGMLPALKFGLTLMATSIVFILFMKVDIMIAAKFIDAKQLGFYAVAMHLALMPMIKVMPLINEVGYPMYAALQHDKNKYEHIFGYLLRIITLFCFPLFFGFAATADELVRLVLGEQWSNAVLPLQLILLTIPLRIISNLFTPLMKALGFPATGLFHISFSLGLTVVAVFIASGYGIAALAASWLITTPLFFFFAVFLCASRARISIKPIVMAVWPPLLLSSVMFGLLYSFQHTLLSEIAVLARLIIMIIIGALFYVLALRLFFKARFNEALKFRI